MANSNPKQSFTLRVLGVGSDSNSMEIQVSWDGNQLIVGKDRIEILSSSQIEEEEMTETLNSHKEKAFNYAILKVCLPEFNAQNQENFTWDDLDLEENLEEPAVRGEDQSVRVLEPWELDDEQELEYLRLLQEGFKNAKLLTSLSVWNFSNEDWNDSNLRIILDVLVERMLVGRKVYPLYVIDWDHKSEFSIPETKKVLDLPTTGSSAFDFEYTKFINELHY